MKNTQRLELRLPQDLKAGLETIANAKGLTLAALVRLILVAYLKDEKCQIR